MTAVPTFAVVSGREVQASLEGREREIVELVEAAYRLHDDGDSVSPDTYSMRFPNRPTARINALPASLGGDVRAHGLKWISSFPENVAAGIPRASGVVILNDYDDRLSVRMPRGLDHQRRTDGGVRGAGGRSSERAARGRPGSGSSGPVSSPDTSMSSWPRSIGRSRPIGVYDVSAESAAGFRGYLEGSANGEAITIHESAEGLIRSSDLVVFATVASEPHVVELVVVRSQPARPPRLASRRRARDRARFDQHRR